MKNKNIAPALMRVFVRLQAKCCQIDKPAAFGILVDAKVLQYK